MMEIVLWSNKQRHIQLGGYSDLFAFFKFFHNLCQKSLILNSPVTLSATKPLIDG